MHTVDHRALHAAAILLAEATILGNLAVGQEHKLLDKLIRLLLLLGIYTQRLALLVEDELELLALEADSSILETLLTHRLSQRIEHHNLLGIVAHTRLNAGLRLGVGEAAVGVYHRTTKPLVKYLGILVELKDCRETEFLLIGAQ